MGVKVTYFIGTVVIGLGATLFMDLFAMFLKWVFRFPLANYCLIGRWLLHMPDGRFMHTSIVATSQKRWECAAGWIVHYVLGSVYALALVAIATERWLVRPTLLPAILFALGSLLVPFLILQPAFGLGVASSRTPNPMRARLRSLLAHTAFGVGLYISAVGVSYVLRVYA
jgi:hypothetical protein